jgi:hypothetical protein
VDVDAAIRAPQRSIANSRLCSKARNCDGGIRQELAAGVGTSNAEMCCRNGASVPLIPPDGIRGSRSPASIGSGGVLVPGCVANRESDDAQCHRLVLPRGIPATFPLCAYSLGERWRLSVFPALIETGFLENQDPYLTGLISASAPS